MSPTSHQVYLTGSASFYQGVRVMHLLMIIVLKSVLEISARSIFLKTGAFEASPRSFLVLLEVEGSSLFNLKTILFFEKPPMK